MKLITRFAAFLVLFSLISAFVRAEMPKTVKSADGHSSCQVETGFQELTYGGTCYDANSVMTGIYSLNPLEIYCSQLTVTCPDHEKEVTAGPGGQGPTPTSN